VSEYRLSQIKLAGGRLKWLVAASSLVYVATTQAKPTPKVAAPASGNTISLEQYLDAVAKNNAQVQAALLSKDAAKLKKRKDDLTMTPFALSANAGFSDDTQETSMPAQQGDHTKGKLYSFELSKVFDTGTSLSAKWGQTYSEVTGTAPTIVIPPGWNSVYQISLSQSLWKNGFGYGTRLRHQREDALTQAAILDAEKSGREALIAAEEAYWDYTVKMLDVKEKNTSLERAEKIRGWTGKRFQNGIGDRADVLQIEALVARRKLEQIKSLNDEQSAKLKFMDALGNQAESANLAPSAQGLSVLRRLAAGERQAIATIAMQSKARAGEAGAKEAVDGTRPDLSLQGSFGANERDASLGTSANGSFGSDNNFYQVGVKLGMSLDFGLQSDVTAAARAEAKAARMISDKLNRDASISWSEIVRQHAELTTSIELMEKLSKTLDDQLAREQTRLEIGRTTTAQVVTFEQEVANARQQLLEMKAAQRKLEAKARLFLTQSEVEAL
jgi:outer membrane protein TolC